MALKIARLPRYVPIYTTISITNDTVTVLSGGDVNAAIATAISMNKRKVLLTAGGTYHQKITLPYHGFPDWMSLETTGTTPANGSRMTVVNYIATHNVPIVYAPINESALLVGAGAKRWRVKGIFFTSEPSYDANGFLQAIVDTSPLFFAAPGDIPDQFDFSHLVIGGVGANHGTANRRVGLNFNASRVVLRDSTIFNINYGGETYANQSQAAGSYAGRGKTLIDNCVLWGGATEAYSLGGAGQYSVLTHESIVPRDITIRRCHIFKPISTFHIQGSANGGEIKLGRGFHLKDCIVENQIIDLQNGYGFVGWSVNQLGSEPYTQCCDVTLQNIWFKNVSCIATTSNGYDGTTQIPMTRFHMFNCVSTGQGIWAQWRTIQFDSALKDQYYHNCTLLGNGSFAFVGNPTPATNLVVEDCLLGNDSPFGGVFDTALGAGQISWDAVNANGTNVFRGNHVIDFYGNSCPNLFENTRYSTYAGFGFVDVSKVLSGSTKYADLGALVNTTGKGADIGVLITALSGVEITDAERAIFEA